MDCVILQPSYIPWRGYFHLIQKSDTFIFYDDVQYDTRGWRNRNKIKTQGGPKWLTIPVNSGGAQLENTPILDIPVCWDTPWSDKHFATIEHSYKKTPFFAEYAPLLREFYSRRDTHLADFTIDFTIALARALGLEKTTFVRSSSLPSHGTKTERLISLLSAVGATHYISGPSARDYIDNSAFEAAGITLEYMTYEYPEYDQLYPPYEPHVSVLDLLFMKGPEAAGYIW